MKKSPLDKRLKRRITGRSHLFFAVCPPGLKRVCRDEMRVAGISKEHMEVLPGGIEFKAKPDVGMKLNLSLGSPSRILMRIGGFKADSFRTLEKKLRGIEWELYLPKNCDLTFNVTTRKSRLYHSDAIAQRCERVVLDAVNNRPPSKTAETGGIKVKAGSSQTLHVRVDNDRVTLSLDSSGGQLFKRGIKKRVYKAPLRENLAFAMLYWSRFSAEDILIDPMCGCGTFSLEAALIKTGYPQGFFRSFAFETWPGFSQKTFAFMKKEAVLGLDSPEQKEIFASDIDDGALEIMKTNLSGHAFTSVIDVCKSDFFSLDPSKISRGKKGVVMINPPYGKRLGDKNTTLSFYREIGRKLSADFKGWRAGIILPAREYKSCIRHNLELKPLFHGGLDLFAGMGLIS